MEPLMRGSAMGDLLPVYQTISIHAIDQTIRHPTMQIGVEMHVFGKLGKTFGLLLNPQLLEQLSQNYYTSQIQILAHLNLTNQSEHYNFHPWLV